MTTDVKNYEYTLNEMRLLSLYTLQGIKRVHLVVEVRIEDSVLGHHRRIPYIKGWTPPSGIKDPGSFIEALDREVIKFRQSIFERYGVGKDPERSFVSIRVIDKI